MCAGQCPLHPDWILLSYHYHVLYVFNHQMVQGYRGVNINTRDNDESLGDMHMDVSNQENVAPVYFQSLSLD